MKKTCFLVAINKNSKMNTQIARQRVRQIGKYAENTVLLSVVTDNHLKHYWNPGNTLFFCASHLDGKPH